MRAERDGEQAPENNGGPSREEAELRQGPEGLQEADLSRWVPEGPRHKFSLSSFLMKSSKALLGGGLTSVPRESGLL